MLKQGRLRAGAGAVALALFALADIGTAMAQFPPPLPGGPAPPPYGRPRPPEPEPYYRPRPRRDDYYQQRRQRAVGYTCSTRWTECDTRPRELGESCRCFVPGYGPRPGRVTP